MKFLILISFIIFSLIDILVGKKSLKSLKRVHQDPSFNPIRSKWISGPRLDMPVQYSKKYVNNHKTLVNHHAYNDQTAKINRRALKK